MHGSSHGIRDNEDVYTNKGLFCSYITFIGFRMEYEVYLGCNIAGILAVTMIVLLHFLGTRQKNA